MANDASLQCGERMEMVLTVCLLQGLTVVLMIVFDSFIEAQLAAKERLADDFFVCMWVYM